MRAAVRWSSFLAYASTSLCSGIALFIHQCLLTHFACAHLLYELDAYVFSMCFFTLLSIMVVCLYVCACDIEHVYVLCFEGQERRV